MQQCPAGYGREAPPARAWQQRGERGAGVNKVWAGAFVWGGPTPTAEVEAMPAAAVCGCLKFKKAGWWLCKEAGCRRVLQAVGLWQTVGLRLAVGVSQAVQVSQTVGVWQAVGVCGSVWAVPAQ